MASDATNPSALTPWQRLRAVLRPEREDLWIVLAHGVAVSVLSLVVPVTAQAIVNTAAFGALLQPLLVLAVVVFSLLLMAGGLRVVQVLVAERIQQRLFARMAVDLAVRLPRVQAETYDKYRGTELVNRFLDVMTIQKGFALILQDGFALVLQAFIGLVLLAFYSPFLLGFDLLLLASMVFVLFGLGRGAVRTSVDESGAKYKVVAWLEEIARVPLAFKGASAAALALRRTDEATESYLHARNSHFRILLRQITGTVLIQAVASGLLLGLGGWLVARQQLSLGQLVAAELIVTPVVGSFAKVGKYLESFYDLLAAVDKVGRLFDLPLEPHRGERLIGTEGQAMTVRLRNITFAHAGSVAPLFEDVNLSIEAGSRVALLGAQGSGKSTLADLATGLRAPRAGSVELDGLDLREASADVLHDQVALVRGLQLFDGTILENVRMGRQNVSMHDVTEALSAMHLLDELSKFPKGLQTQLSGSHRPLSAGQAIRLMLARALVGRPRLLVVDEALDAVGEDRRDAVLDALMRPNACGTLLLTTHVPEIAARCQRTFRVEAGGLKEVLPS